MHPLEKRILIPEDLTPVSSFENYQSIGGLVGLEKARKMSSEQLIELV